MPLISLNRINKGGEILVNSDHILFVEVESRTTTVHLSNGMLFSVEESLATLAAKVQATDDSGARPAGRAQSGAT
jgi:uncharacterized protein YlzI (FlbEa/FlbD family)